MPRKAEFEAAHISARDLQVGDLLDISGKTRVHAVSVRDNNVIAGHRTRGSRGGGVTSYSKDQAIKVWRKKK